MAKKGLIEISSITINIKKEQGIKTLLERINDMKAGRTDLPFEAEIELSAEQLQELVESYGFGTPRRIKVTIAKPEE